MRTKQGKLSWDLLVVLILALTVLVALLIFSNSIRESIVGAFQSLLETMFGE